MWYNYNINEDGKEVKKIESNQKKYNLYKHYIKESDSLYPVLDEWSHLANNLYNDSLFVMRQLFTGLPKDPDKREPLETKVLEEVLEIKKTYKRELVLNKEKRLVDYPFLEHYFKTKNNQNYNSFLPKQTSQAVIKEAVTMFYSWLKALKNYKKYPSMYTGKPKMPGYKKSGGCSSFSLTNQDVLFKKQKHNHLIKFPKTKVKLSFNKKIRNERLKSVNVKKEYGVYKITFLFEDLNDPVVPIKSDVFCGIDLGVNNLAAIVTNKGDSLLVKGEFIKSKNQWFNKQIAKNLRGQTIGTNNKRISSKALNKLCRKRQLFIEDIFHKVAKKIVLWCVDKNVSTIIIGKNKDWKRNIKIGKTNNQNFVQIPHSTLITYIKTVAIKSGVAVIETEESYTSKASFLDKDIVPSYKKEENVTYLFSGKRIKRGLYKDGLGRTINADLNGAGNIMRKVVDDKNILVNINNLTSPSILKVKEIYA